MLWSIENLWVSDTIELSTLIEFLGSISMADVSSNTYLHKHVITRGNALWHNVKIVFEKDVSNKLT